MRLEAKVRKLPRAEFISITSQFWTMVSQSTVGLLSLGDGRDAVAERKGLSLAADSPEVLAKVALGPAIVENAPPLAAAEVLSHFGKSPGDQWIHWLVDNIAGLPPQGIS